MTEDSLNGIRSWFAGYCQSFYDIEEGERRNLLLKEDHTHRVCANAIRIGVDEGLHGEDLFLAEAAALLHDVGRFEQYRQYRTFRDSISVDHGALGVEILLDSDILAGLDPRDRRVILATVGKHNSFKLSKRIAGETLNFLRLVRDADKLDIWRIFLDYYGQSPDDRPSAVGLGFADLPHCSPRVCEKIEKRETVQLSSARTLNDFKLVQLSWVFDLTLSSSFRLLEERDYINGIAATLPMDSCVQLAVDTIREFVTEKAAAAVQAFPS